jgi:hypothetical protein
MKLTDAIDMKGRLTLRLKNQAGELIEEIAADNAIVLKGRRLVADLFTQGVGAKPISHIAVGTGNKPVIDGDSALEVEVFRKAIKPTVNITEIGNRVHVMVSTDLELTDTAANKALTEAAIFNADNIMYNRVVFQPVNKTADFKLSLVWEIIF